jgi:hypothetical protein
MDGSTETRLKQVQRYGTALRRLSKVLFAAAAFAVGAVVLLLLFGNSSDTLFLFGTIEYRADTIPAGARAFIILGFVWGAALLLKLLFHLIRLFDLYADGKIFTVENVRQLRLIGITLFLFLSLWVLELVAQFVVPEVVVQDSAATTTSINLNIPFSVIIVGTVIVFFSWIMDVGRELREDQDLVV